MEIPEAKSLRWLAIQFPLVEKPKDDIEKIQSLIHLYCTAGANRLESIDAENIKLKAELEKVKQERDSAIRELRYLSVCSTCEENGIKCHVSMPVKENDVCCGGYKWRGAKDTNVPSKEE